MCDILCRVTLQTWNSGACDAADPAARVNGAIAAAHVRAAPLDSMPRFGGSERFSAPLRHAQERLARHAPAIAAAWMNGRPVGSRASRRCSPAFRRSSAIEPQVPS